LTIAVQNLHAGLANLLGPVHRAASNDEGAIAMPPRAPASKGVISRVTPQIMRGSDSRATTHVGSR